MLDEVLDLDGVDDICLPVEELPSIELYSLIAGYTTSVSAPLK